MNGATSTVSVTTVPVDGNQSVTIAAGQEATAEITNTYDFVPGSLTVQKVVEGPGAGQQGTITITTTCVLNGTSTTLSPPLVVAAGKPAGTYSQTYDDIPAGSECTAHVSADGSTPKCLTSKTATAPPSLSPRVGPPPFPLQIRMRPGNLVINKTIAGPARGSKAKSSFIRSATALSSRPTSPSWRTTADGTYSHHLHRNIGRLELHRDRDL